MIENYTLIEYVQNGWVVTTFTEDGADIRESKEIFKRGEFDTEPDEDGVVLLYALADMLGVEQGSKHSKKRLKICLVDADDFVD